MINSNPILRFLATEPRIIHVVVREVKGSSPRDEGAEMFVSESAIAGTIGGGRLEYIVIQAAREMFERGEAKRHLDQPLGPEIGQCCGGRVALDLSEMDAGDKARAEARLRAAQAGLPHVYVMGAGHVGRALVDLLQFLPVRSILVDSREGELALSGADVETRLTALPEHEIATAPAGSAFIILTHEHSLDFLLASEALKRGDAAYVGLIGSRSKRAKFRNFCRKECDGLLIDALICPIGTGGSRDKRPGVIAASVVAEVLAAVL